MRNQPADLGSVSSLFAAIRLSGRQADHAIRSLGVIESAWASAIVLTERCPGFASGQPLANDRRPRLSTTFGGYDSSPFAPINSSEIVFTYALLCSTGFRPAQAE